MRSPVVKLLLICSAVLCLPLAGQKVIEDSWLAKFDRNDQVARRLIDAVTCVTQLGEGLNQGTFKSDSILGPDYQCLEEKGRKLAVLARVDSAATRILGLYAMDRSDLSRYYGAVDTARVLQMLQASFKAIEQVRPLYLKKQREFAPFTIRGAGDSIEVWFLPVEMALEQKDARVVGGEYGVIFSPRADTLVRRVDEIEQQHLFSPPSQGVVRFGDLHRDLPFITELMLAHWLNAAGRTVTIETESHRSNMGGGMGAGAVWLHFDRSSSP